MVSVGGGYDWWVGDVGGGDICVFAVDDDEEKRSTKEQIKQQHYACTLITSNIADIYMELALYAVFLAVCGLIVGGISVLYFRKQVLNEAIKSSGSPSSKNLFRKGSLLVQLTISLVMMFCTLFVKCTEQKWWIL